VITKTRTKTIPYLYLSSDREGFYPRKESRKDNPRVVLPMAGFLSFLLAIT
jgi:hypothetical protein